MNNTNNVNQALEELRKTIEIKKGEISKKEGELKNAEAENLNCKKIVEQSTLDVATKEREIIALERTIGDEKRKGSVLEQNVKRLSADLEKLRAEQKKNSDDLSRLSRELQQSTQAQLPKK